ncbi:hypothetical protein D3C80_2134880 [compost metagenome]
MRTMYRITGLEANNCFPALLCEDAASFCWIEIEFIKLLWLWTVQYGNCSAYISRWTLEQLLHARVL